MPLQNRVCPDGTLHRIKARGILMGNRGILHDPKTKTLAGRNWTHKAWIVCVCQFKGRKRPVFAKGAYSELFFLDEVTALAAGHRPCFECRRGDAVAFRNSLPEAKREICKTAPMMDKILHEQRFLSRRSPPEMISQNQASTLPDGTMVLSQDQFFARKNSGWLKWGFHGYTAPSTNQFHDEIILITPSLIIDALQGGYQPLWHESVKG